MTTIGAAAAAMTAASAASSTTASTGSKAGSGNLDRDAFLKLLVAQLKYQDPTNPADSTQFLAQTAQFTMVEKLDDMVRAQHDLLAAQFTMGASNLVGRTVTYVDENGMETTGIVTSATLSDSPTVRVGNTDVPLSSVREVRAS